MLQVGDGRCHSNHQAITTARNSSCPDQLGWLPRVSQTWISEMTRTQTGCKGPNAMWVKGGCKLLKPLVFLNVGANKGFAVAAMMQRFTLNAGFTNADWLTEMGEYLMHTYGVSQQALMTFVKEYCGACIACTERSKPLPNLTTSIELDVHAFEIAQANVKWLRWAFARFGVRASIVRAAATNQSGRVRVPVYESIEDFGDERASVRGEGAKMIHHVCIAFRTPKLSSLTLLARGRARTRTALIAASSAATSTASVGSTCPAFRSTTTFARRA